MMMLPWFHRMDGRIMLIASCFGFAMPFLSAALKLKECKFRRGQIIPRSFLERATLICATVLLLLASPGWGQAPLQLLHGHVRPEVSSAQAQLVAHLPSSQQIYLSIELPLRNETELNSLLHQLYDSTSPNYHQFLSVSQFTERFGPTPEDYQAVVDFVKNAGFTVTDLPSNRLIVSFSGSAGQIEKAFHVTMNIYRHPTENRLFFSPDREPSLELTVPVVHIAGLNNFSIPRPALSKANGLANTTGSGPGGSYLPNDMRTAYYGSATLTGSGQCVGLVEFDGYNISDVVSSFNGAASYTSNGGNYSLSYTVPGGGGNFSIPINNVLVNGGTLTPLPSDPNAEAEVVLDIAQAIGMAPGINQLRVYIAPDSWSTSGNYVFPSNSDDLSILNQAVTEDACKQLSISWNWRPESITYLNNDLSEMGAQGQNFFAASGDYGSWPNSAYYFPEELQDVTAVGGTDLTTSGPGGSWVSETVWSDSGGGISPDEVPIPSWQSGIANSCNQASTTYRNVPDVAMEANFDNYVCNMGSCSGGWGGTSFAAPRWAGFMALVNQQAVNAGRAPVGGLGFINPTVYSLGEGPNYLNDLHDIASGSNGAYSACPGYDLVTGWGSPVGQNLINDMVGSAPLPTATPSESNVIVTLNGIPPSSINYAITFQDATPGATIYYQVTICNTPYAWETTTSGSTVNFYNSCPSTTPYGTMYATAPGYLQSASTSMSF